MSILYRCLWADTSEPERRGVVDLARDCFSRWVLEDASAASLPDGEFGNDLKRIEVRSVDSEFAYGVEGVAREIDASSGQGSAVWTVSMRVLANEDRVLVWVDLDMESDDPAKRVKIGRPRLVEDLLRLPGKPSLGISNIIPGCVEISAPEIPVLVDLLRSPERTLPFIVFSSTYGNADTKRLEVADRTAARVAGVATVLALDDAATSAFRSSLGDLAVWGGAARIYLPAPLDTEADGWRHRYVVASKLNQPGASAVDGLVYAAAQLSARRRVPAEFRLFAKSPKADIEATELDSLEERWQFELDLAYEERGEVERELARANGHLDRMRRELDRRHLADLYWGSSRATDDPSEPPDIAQDVSDAVAAAQLYLADFLVIPPNAPRDLEGINSAPNAYAWGNTAWRGFRALAAYAQTKRDGFAGNFWSWCERGDPLAWPATKKKLAMQESDTVKNGKHAESRMFDVDLEVNGSGKIFMEAHLKISEGGGDLAPRVYFYDDIDGKTKKVHVGFVGPHYLVPNTKG